MTQAAGVAIVTGASRGIGEAIAKRLAKDGHAVIVNYAAVTEDAEKVVSDIRKADGRALVVRADVSSAEEVKNLFNIAEKEFGPVNIVVNNAGVNVRAPTMLIDTDDDSYEHIFETNARGTFNMLREAGRRMQKGGRIVNFSSTVNALSVPGFTVYGATKAAIEAMTNLFSKELSGREINVNCISPGPTATEFFYQGKSDELIQSYTKMRPVNRLAKPEEMANVVAFLVGPDSTWVNGQTIMVNGGIVS